MKRASAFIKSDRLLRIYSRLISGETLNKKELAQQFNVTERSIQRDLESLRLFLVEQSLQQSIVYDKQARGYRLERDDLSTLSNNEILAVCKILIESQSMCKDKMNQLLDKLIACCVPECEKKTVASLVANEKRNYIPPQHDIQALNNLWEIGQAVERHLVVEVEYWDQNGETVSCSLEPAGLIFSGRYFYLVGFLLEEDHQEELQNPEDPLPAVYRMDYIQRYSVTDQHFTSNRVASLQEEHVCKLLSFPCGDKLSCIRFQYTGPSIEEVLERLTASEILSVKNGVYTVQAEGLGKEIEMWLKSHTDYVNQIQG